MSELPPMHSKEEGFGSHLVEREGNSAASLRGKGVDMNAHAGCRNRVYDNNIPSSVPAAGGSSLCSFDRTILRTSGQMDSLSRHPFIPTGEGDPPPEKGRYMDKGTTTRVLRTYPKLTTPRKFYAPTISGMQLLVLLQCILVQEDNSRDLLGKHWLNKNAPDRFNRRLLQSNGYQSPCAKLLKL